jgi:hypothetical protein
MADTEHGKKAEEKIKLWLDRPDLGYSFDRIPDQMTGFYQISRNICDFTLYRSPNMYYIESKCTVHDRFDFSELTKAQRDGLRVKAELPGCYGLVIVLFAEYKRAFIFNIKDIADIIDPERPIVELVPLIKSDIDIAQLKIKSVNIKKIDKWGIPYYEIPTIPSRKQFWDYTGEFPNI